MLEGSSSECVANKPALRADLCFRRELWTELGGDKVADSLMSCFFAVFEPGKLGGGVVRDSLSLEARWLANLAEYRVEYGSY